jgi:hypothetical protein
MAKALTAKRIESAPSGPVRKEIPDGSLVRLFYWCSLRAQSHSLFDTGMPAGRRIGEIQNHTGDTKSWSHERWRWEFTRKPRGVSLRGTARKGRQMGVERGPHRGNL